MLDGLLANVNLPPVVKQFAAALAEALPRLFQIFQSAGGRDGFLVALDSALEVSRQKARDDLRRKHDVDEDE